MERFAMVFVVTFALCLFVSTAQASQYEFTMSAQMDSAEEGSDARPVSDPFKCLIKKPKPPKPDNTYTPPPPPPLKTAIPPLQLKVTAIAGEDDKYVAVIRHEGKDFIVENEWEEEHGLFKVKSVTADKVEVFYSKTKKRQSFFF